MPENKFEFVILHEGWELDNKGWFDAYGKGWTTNHTGLRPLTIGAGEARISLVRRRDFFGKEAKWLTLLWIARLYCWRE